MSIKRHIIIIWICFLPMLLHAQTEAEIKNNAEQLFDKEQYVEATPLYLRLLSLQPRDYEYNFKYGTCLLFNSNKKQDAIRYLSYAVTSETTDPAVHFFLGRAYHLNYQFNEAIKEYQKYQSIVGAKGKYTNDAVRNVEMCRNGKKLLSTITEIIVIKKSEIKSADFFRIYDLSNIGGSFVVAADFQSKMDKKMNHVPLVHFPQGTDKIFYSSYGEGTNKDIYMVRRLPDGKFSLPQLVQGGVNSPFEEDYPYLHPSGDFLYFSSKGHNSMGGFDVFRSRFDVDNNSFGPAENIDFSISSPDDDILYVVDKDDKNAYFASSRQSQDGKLFVYQVKVDRVPIQLAVVKGSFESGINPQNKSMTVEVIDKLSDKNIGTFKSNAKGTYLVTFPKGGKYEYRVTVDGSNENFTCQVEIPYLKEFKPLKQKMLHEVLANKETVRIVNLFNEDVEDAQAIIAQVLKDRSDLNVNIDKFDINELENIRASKKILAEIGASEMSVFEVGQMLERRSTELSNAEKGLSKEVGAVNALVVTSTARIKEIDKEVKELVKEADQSESDVVQHSILMEAKQLIDERNEQLKSISELEKVGSQMSGGGDVSVADQQKFNTIQKKYNELIKSDKQGEALQIIQDNNSFIKKVLQGEGNSHETDLIAQQKKIEVKLNEAKALSLTFENEINKIEAEIRTLEEQKGNVKDKFKAEIQDKIEYKKQQLVELENQLKFSQTKQVELAEQRKAIIDELDLIRNIQNYSGNKVTSDQVAKAKGELGNQNANTLAQYVDGQISELVKNNPSLENSKGNLSESAKLIAIHNSKAEAILGNESLSESQRKSQLAKFNTETLNQLQERFVIAKANLTEDKFNDELAKEIAENEKFSAKLKAENEAGNQIASTNNYSDVELEKELNPNYKSAINEINNNSNYSEKEKWNTLNKADNTYVKAIDSELNLVDNKLKANPQNQELLEKKKALEAKKSELNNSIEQRNEQIAALSVNESIEKITESSVIAKLDPAYIAKKQGLNPNSSNVNELQELQTLDEAFLNQLNESNAEIKSARKSKPTDSKLIEEEKVVEDLIKKTKAEVTSRANKIEELEKSEIVVVNEKSDSEVRKELLASIPTSIDDEIKKINSSNSSSVEKQEIEINKRTSYISELESLKASKAKSENATEEATKREISILDEMIQSQKSIIEKVKAEQGNEPITNLASKDDIKNEVNANHSQEIAELKNSDLSEAEKNAKVLAAEKSYLNQLISAKSSKEKELKRNAESPALQNDVALLKEIVAEQEVIISELEKSTNVTIELLTKEDLKNEVKANHSQEIAELKNSDLSEAEKNAKVLAEEKSYLSELKSAQSSKEKELKRNVDSPALKNDLTLLKEIVAEQDNVISELEKSTNVSVELLTKEDIKNKVNSNHTKEIAELKNSDLSEAEKIAKVLAAEKSYLNQLISAQSSKEKELKLNSESPVLKNDVALLNEIIAEQENVILELESSSNNMAEMPTKESVMKQIDPAFNADIAKIEKLKGKEKYDLLIKREQELQSNLETKISELQLGLSKEASNENLNAELNIATKEYQESIARVSGYASERTKLQDNATVDSKEMIADLRKSLLTADNIGQLDNIYSTEKELKEQDAILAEYELKISQKLNEKKQLNETTETKRRTQEIEILEKELETVQKKRRSVSVSIGEIEQNSIARTPANNGEKITELDSKESELQAKLASSELSPNEKKAIKKELAEVSNEKASLEIPIAKEKIENNKAELSALLDNEKTPTSIEIKNQLKAKEEVIDEIIVRASKEKSDVAKNYLLNEALAMQKEAKDDFMESKVDARNNEIQESNGISVNQSKAELESKVRRFSVEVGEITQELNAQKKAQSTAKSSKKESFNAPIESLEADLVVAKLNLKQAELDLSRVVEQEDLIAKESVKTEITYSEEFEIATSTEYSDYAKAAKSALDIENQIVKFEKLIAEEDKEIKKLIEAEIYEGADNSVAINDKAKRIQSYSVQIGDLQTQLDESKKSVAQYTPSNTDQQMKFDNLVMRGINPIKKAAIALALVPLPASGIEINATGTTTNYTASNPIPVNVESPSGLVYRVQVGAFARPIPQDLFKEFTPVSGEKIANTNITRYMAGFFNNSDKVVDAREQIKSLGYSDAFIVAYCDGKRITFGEARNLEKSGLCVPKEASEMMLEIAEKTSKAMGYDDTSKVVKPVSEYSYNDVPGSAKAEQIERIEGLFFTVQIAVHSKPVAKEQLLNIEPLLTLRLPNGQIRYSTGVYPDYSAAVSKQNFVVGKGITDAFVTAYYKGERITWQEGLVLLEKNDKSILAESKNGVPIFKKKEEEKVVQKITIEEVFTSKEIKSKEVLKDYGVQIVSKKVFSEYPRDVMNRYNAKGSFYYDIQDQKVKSVIYDSEDHLPRIHGFKDDVDTVFYTAIELNSMNSNTLLIKIEEPALKGDFTDWMLKLNYRREIIRLKNGLEIRIFDVRDEALQKVKSELSLFGVTAIELEKGK